MSQAVGQVAAVLDQLYVTSWVTQSPPAETVVPSVWSNCMQPLFALVGCTSHEQALAPCVHLKDEWKASESAGRTTVGAEESWASGQRYGC